MNDYSVVPDMRWAISFACFFTGLARLGPEKGSKYGGVCVPK